MLTRPDRSVTGAEVGFESQTPAARASIGLRRCRSGLVPEVPQDAAGIPDRDAVRGQATGNDAAGADRRVVANRYARENADAGPEPHVAADRNRAGQFQ